MEHVVVVQEKYLIFSWSAIRFIQYGGMSQQIDRRIIKKIHQLVRDGLRNIKEMQRALGVHFKTELFDAEQLPPGNSTRFYPEESAICNHVCNAAPKLYMSKVD